jgi:hypothetical protein
MAKITIDGVAMHVGRNLTINGDKIIVDGVVQPQHLSGVTEIRIVEGVLAELHTDRSVHCENVEGNVHAGASVNCEKVGGSVRAGASVNCGNVKGSVTAGASVNCDDIGGSVHATIVKRG